MLVLTLLLCGLTYILRSALCYFVLVFLVLSALRLPRLRSELSLVLSICTCLVLSASSLSLCIGITAAFCFSKCVVMLACFLFY